MFRTLASGSTQGPHRARLVACMLAALPLAACNTVDRTVPTGSVPFDYHERHPVVLANAPQILDIFPVGPTGELDRRQMRDVDVLAAEYLSHAQGSIVIEAPQGAIDQQAVERTVNAVRRRLAANGLRGSIQLGTYLVSDPRLASPLHIRYDRLQARGASRCGDWPDDLGSGSNLNGMQNRSYYNLGCATSQTLAAQIDDPRDLLRPRAEDPTDVVLRTRAIGLLRGTSGATQGKDPGTTWSGAEPTPISPIGN